MCPYLGRCCGTAVGVGLAHSILGERFILIRLFRRDLPRLFGTDLWTKRILRFAWHVTTIAWFGFAAVLVVLASNTESPGPAIGWVVAVTYVMSAVLIAVPRGSAIRRGRCSSSSLHWFGSVSDLPSGRRIWSRPSAAEDEAISVW